MNRLINAAQRLVTRQPPAVERRLHERALLYWREVQQGQEVPLLDQFDFTKLENEAAHGFLLDVSSPPDVSFVFVGEVLRDEARLPDAATKLTDSAAASLLGRFGRQWKRAVTERAPMTAEYDFVTAAGYDVYCRGVLLPLSTDGIQIDRVYGVVSWKSERLR